MLADVPQMYNTTPAAYVEYDAGHAASIVAPVRTAAGQEYTVKRHTATRFSASAAPESLSDLTALRQGDTEVSKEIETAAEVERRLRDLEAIANEEGIAINPPSVRDLKAMLRAWQVSKRPAIALLDNGNVRAVWQSASGSQIGLHFAGNQIIHYVCFRRDGPTQALLRSFGTIRTNEVLPLMQVFNAVQLIRS